MAHDQANDGDCPDEEIQRVIREEKRRGNARRQVDEDLLALQRQFERDFYRLLAEGDEQKFRSFLTAHGLPSGKFQAAMQQWRAYQKNRRKKS